MPNPLIDFLNQIRTAEEGADLTAIFENLETGIEGQAAALAERDTAIETLNGEITQLKVKNFDLIQRIPQQEITPQAGNEELEENESIGINDLFKKTGGEE